MKGKYSFPIYLIAAFWSFCAFALTFFIPAVLLHIWTYENPIETILLWLVFFVFLIPVFILVTVILKFKSLVQVFLVLLPAAVIFLSIANFTQDCEGIGCGIKGIIITFPLMLIVCLSAGILPLTSILSKEETNNLFKKSLLPGLFVVIFLFISVHLSNYPEYKKSFPQMKESIQSHERFIQIKNEEALLSPTYLPAKIIQTTKTEKEEDGRFITSFSCESNQTNEGYFKVWQTPQGKEEIIKDGYVTDKSGGHWIKIVENVDISGIQGQVIEKYIGANPKYLSSGQTFPPKAEFQARQLVWKENNLQIIIGNEPFFGSRCALPKEELVKIAESMRPLK